MDKKENVALDIYLDKKNAFPPDDLLDGDSFRVRKQVANSQHQLIPVLLSNDIIQNLPFFSFWVCVRTILEELE